MHIATCYRASGVGRPESRSSNISRTSTNSIGLPVMSAAEKFGGGFVARSKRALKDCGIVTGLEVPGSLEMRTMLILFLR